MKFIKEQFLHIVEKEKMAEFGQRTNPDVLTLPVFGSLATQLYKVYCQHSRGGRAWSMRPVQCWLTLPVSRGFKVDTRVDETPVPGTVYMIRSGITNLPLHGGSCPRWLFPRMCRLSGAISELIIDEFGTQEYLRRLSDPYFFQALGCVIGFDWHSSGLTTTTLGALKASINKQNLGISIAGGKDKIPYEIDRKHYDETIGIMKNAIQDSKIGQNEKLSAIKRLSGFYC